MALPQINETKRFEITVKEYKTRVGLLTALNALVSDKPDSVSGFQIDGATEIAADFLSLPNDTVLYVTLSADAAAIYINHLANDRANIELMSSELNARKAAIKSQLDQIGSQVFDETGSKQIAPGLLLKEETDFVYDQAAALKWALEAPAARAAVFAVGKTHEATVFAALVTARPDLISCLTINDTLYKKAGREGLLAGIPGVKEVTRSVSVTVANVAPLLPVETNFEKPATMEDVPF